MSATFWQMRRRKAALEKQLENQKVETPKVDKIDEPKAEVKKTVKKTDGKSK